jgi:hypothetical protein
MAAAGGEITDLGRRVFIENRGLVHVALIEADTSTLFQIYGRKENHFVTESVFHKA